MLECGTLLQLFKESWLPDSRRHICKCIDPLTRHILTKRSEVRAHRGYYAGREGVFSQSIQCIDDSRNGTCRIRCRAMARSVSSSQSQPHRDLLRYLNAENSLPIDIETIVTLVNQQSRTAKDLRVLLDEPTGTKETTGFLVRSCNENQVAVQLDTCAMQTQKCCEVRDSGAFHIERAATPQISVTNFS
jgi:hypothetical protein